MKKIILAFWILCGLLLHTAAQTPPDAPHTVTPAEQTELTKLNQETVKLFSAGKLNEALKSAEIALQRTKTLYGTDSVQMVTAWQNLAEVQIVLKKYGAAAANLRLTLDSQEKKLGAEALPVAAILTRLGLAYYYDGQSDDSEKALARALAIREQKLPADSPLIAEAAELLAQSYQVRGVLEKAAPLYERAVKIQEKRNPAPGGLTLLRERYGCIQAQLNPPVDNPPNVVTSRMPAEKKEPQKETPTTTLPQITVMNGGILNGKALFMAPSTYPGAAKRNRTSGSVSVKVLLDEAGQVILACAIKGNTLFYANSENAAYNSRFPVTLWNGKPIKVVGILNYNYVAQ